MSAAAAKPAAPKEGLLEKILDFSIHQRVGVVFGSVLLLVLGIWQMLRLPIDVQPDLTPRQVVVNAMAPALGPEEIERQITFPLEMALNGLPHLIGISSISQFGLSQVIVQFDDDTDIYFARQMIDQRLTQVDLPAGVRAEMGPISTGLGEICHLKLEGDLPLMERRSLMDWVVRPQLLSVPGLAEVNTWGGQVRQYQVRIDTNRLNATGYSVRDVVAALQDNNQNAGGSYLVTDGQQQLVRTLGTVGSLDDIRQIVIGARNGVPVLVRHVADVVEGPAARQGAMSEDGKGEQVYALTLLLIGENGRVVMQRVKEKVAEIERSLPKGCRLVLFLDRSELIDRTLNTVNYNLVEGAFLVIVILFLFLLQVHVGLIVSSIIPLSMLIAVIGMQFMGLSGNLISLGAIDFGVIVDGAVIIVENAVRRLAAAQHGRPLPLREEERLHVLRDAAAEVLHPSVFGVIIILVTYLPIISLGGIEGKMFRPMGITVILALSGSLVLSLTLIPALCAFFLKGTHEKHNRVLDRVNAWYQRTLTTLLRRRRTVMTVVIPFCIACAGLFPYLGSEFIPDLSEGAVAASVFFPPSTPLEVTLKRCQEIEILLHEQFPDEVDRVLSRVGRPEVATDPMLSSQADVFIALKPPKKWKRARTQPQLTDQIAKALEAIPGMAVSYTQPIKMRMMEMIEGQGMRSDLGIKIFGPDPDVLAAEGARLAQIVSKVPGAGDVKPETTKGLPQLQIRVLRDRAARWGVPVSAVNEVVEAAVGGRTVTSFNDGSQRIDIAVRLPEADRNSVARIRALRIPTPSGATVPLAEVADVRTVEGPVQISRENGRRRYAVLANVRGRDLGGFVEDVKKRLATFHLPPGYSIELGGTYEHLQSGRARLALVVPATFIVVFMMLYFTFGSVWQAALVFSGVPFAMTGGILALWLRGMPFSMSAGVGFIALGGVAVLNGVVMLTFIEHLREKGASPTYAVLEGAHERLRPVLMTASVASFGFVPMALSTGAGAEVQRPLATVVIGGLITSTVLTLFVLPLLYAWSDQVRRNLKDSRHDGHVA